MESPAASGQASKDAVVPSQMTPSKRGLEDQELTDWQRINSLPEDIRKMALMSFSLSSLVEAYQSKEDKVLKILSDLTFWREKLEQGGYLDPTIDNSEWLRFWVGSSGAIEMVVYLDNQTPLFPSIAIALNDLLQLSHLYQNRESTDLQVIDSDFKSLVTGLAAFTKNLREQRVKLDAIRLTWDSVKWVHRNLRQNQDYPIFIWLPKIKVDKTVRKLSFEDYLSYWNNRNFGTGTTLGALSSTILTDYEAINLDQMSDKKATLLLRIRLLLRNLRKYDHGVIGQQSFILMPDEQGKLTIYLGGEGSVVDDDEDGFVFLPYQALEMLVEYEVHDTYHLWEHRFTGIMTPEGPFLLGPEGAESDFEGWTLVGSLHGKN